MNAEVPLSVASNDSREVKRYAFLLKLRPVTEKNYDKLHESVPSELIASLRRVGIREYSIFRRHRLLFLTLSVADFERTWPEIELDPAYKVWQKTMEPFFETVSDLRPGERFPMLEEVFYLP